MKLKLLEAETDADATGFSKSCGFDIELKCGNSMEFNTVNLYTISSNSINDVVLLR